MNPARLHGFEEKQGRNGEMNEAGTLRRMAREAIRAGRLPDRVPDRMWGGPGLGAQCSICGAPVEQGEFGVKLEFVAAAAAPDRHLVHVNCFSALASERKESRSGGMVFADQHSL